MSDGEGTPIRTPGSTATGRPASIRVLVVDDSTTIRAILRRLLDANDDIEVVGSAADGRQALEAVDRLKPDVVTLDVEMPNLDGLQTLELLFQQHPVPVVMCSSLTSEGAAATIRALELGAVDFIEKPGIGALDGALGATLSEKVRHAAQAQVRRRVSPVTHTPRAFRGSWQQRILLIGASTGGPSAVREVMTSLPPDFGLPIVIVQHMPAGFTRSFAQRLNTLGPLPVDEAEPGMRLEPGRALLAPGGYHLEFDAARRVVLTETPPEEGVRPAVNVTMESIAHLHGANAIAVVLTGMGRDGKRGAELIRNAGGTVIVEDKSTCVVYGMPRAIAEADLADEILPRDKIASAIVRHATARPAVRAGIR
ncbi:MAG: chemotaxis response regulator protein-glutamate methylesterase [Dehalococcoidia bacterium]|nr:chemotaxis response regulator protein-glutamate methylesterase [Dehalococcoidia bacterium]MCA9849375.1 chemotaxis response regulator protein-glutamate methylesterase [Dehalococcoidia bacterium]MCA9856528.1 chemotaxis response regulator protein-glutamate methylesterase [Dehalococcoidia bacterium]MCB9484419.1 chemotaxis response regulator protein-glutamate methylesterase [Dehalococcoidia bacterium]